MNKVQRVVLVGPMGAGKTTIGRFVANEIGFDYLDSDAEIERVTGADIPWIFDIEGEEGFRRRESAMISSLLGRDGVLIATGGGAILKPENRHAIKENAYVVYLKTGVEAQLQRTRKDRRRPLLQTDDPRAVLERLAQERNPLYDEVAHWIADTDGRSIKQVGQGIVRHLQTLDVLCRDSST